jgi:hypothetical protein
LSGDFFFGAEMKRELKCISFVKMMFIQNLAIFLCILVLLCPSISFAQNSSSEEIKQARCNINPDKCYEQATFNCQPKKYQVKSTKTNPGGLFADVLPGPFTLSQPASPELQNNNLSNPVALPTNSSLEIERLKIEVEEAKKNKRS